MVGPSRTLARDVCCSPGGGRMTIRMFVITALLYSLFAAASAFAVCGDNAGDMDAVAAARAAIAMNCPCGLATSHRDYRKCANGVVASQNLTSQCARKVKQCAARSTCGRPGYVSCCRTNSLGA